MVSEQTYCDQCLNALNAGARFCTSCGRKITPLAETIAVPNDETLVKSEPTIARTIITKPSDDGTVIIERNSAFGQGVSDFSPSQIYQPANTRPSHRARNEPPKFLVFLSVTALALIAFIGTYLVVYTYKNGGAMLPWLNNMGF